MLGGAALDGFVKTCAALAVAAFRQSDYWIAYFTQLLRRGKGLDDRALVELAGAIMHYVSFNTIAHGMRLEARVEGISAADVVPGGKLEHLVPGARRRTTRPDTRSSPREHRADAVAAGVIPAQRRFSPPVTQRLAPGRLEARVREQAIAELAIRVGRADSPRANRRWSPANRPSVGSSCARFARWRK